MSCEIPVCVERYLISVESDSPRACREQHALLLLRVRALSQIDSKIHLLYCQQFLLLS